MVGEALPPLPLLTARHCSCVSRSQPEISETALLSPQSRYFIYSGTTRKTPHDLFTNVQ